MTDVRQMLEDMTEALPEVLDIDDALAATGMLATSLIAQCPRAEDRAALTERFCTTLREGADVKPN